MRKFAKPFEIAAFKLRNCKYLDKPAKLGAAEYVSGCHTNSRNHPRDWNHLPSFAVIALGAFFIFLKWA